ncbi:TetR/AcrR family transcriptional regulator [Nocardia amikacinitolerans]|uniref:TetR/AcrR family transcriptional regulator n=1 Tax=Nocardia amikacinitolerans TaxID=756689 RepID=UPI0020A24A10|nr:TetR/AcrR family transcriptional regulator [Nocardia amikacinitolerans]MCP2280591.1 transcriptional regulator, TetR family [Nocardia amikacinitolerans]
MTDTDSPLPTRPARGTRPTNRRALVVSAAAELFARDGYANVGVGQVADAVAVGPSALYRHFRNKRDLLHAVVTEALATFETLLGDVREHPADAISVLAAAVLAQRRIGVLWRRESRHLDGAARRELRGRLRAVGARLADVLRARRPELDPVRADMLAWSALAVATSISFHRLRLPGDRFEQLLAEMMTAVADAEIPALERRGARPADTADRWYPSRRAAILDEASRLFDRYGFAGVGMEDIGAAVGIAGPSVYNHFASKAEILTELFARGNLILQADLQRDLARATSAADALHRLVGSYTAYSLENPALIRLLVTSEADQLGQEESHRMRGAQHEYVSEWVGLVRGHHPEMDPIEARIRVHAALGAVNDIAATPHLRASGGIEEAARIVCGVLLRIDAPRG